MTTHNLIKPNSPVRHELTPGNSREQATHSPLVNAVIHIFDPFRDFLIQLIAAMPNSLIAAFGLLETNKALKAESSESILPEPLLIPEDESSDTGSEY